MNPVLTITEIMLNFFFSFFLLSLEGGCAGALGVPVVCRGRRGHCVMGPGLFRWGPPRSDCESVRVGQIWGVGCLQTDGGEGVCHVRGPWPWGFSIIRIQVGSRGKAVATNKEGKGIEARSRSRSRRLPPPRGRTQRSSRSPESTSGGDQTPRRAVAPLQVSHP